MLVEVHEDLARALDANAAWARRFSAIVRKLESIHTPVSRHRALDRRLDGGVYKTRLTRELRLVYEVHHSADGVHLRFITPVLDHADADRLHMPRYLSALRSGVPPLREYFESDAETLTDLAPELDFTVWEVPELFRPVQNSGDGDQDQWSWGAVSLDDEQRILTHRPGPVFLAGAPGTGKSTVAHARMRTWQNERDSILYVTFSERLKQRVEHDQRHAPADGKRRDIRTFRELCLDHIARRRGESHPWIRHNGGWREDGCVTYNAFRRWWDDGAGGVKSKRRSADAWREFQDQYTPALIRERARMRVEVVETRLQSADRGRLERNGCTDLFRAFEQYRSWTHEQGMWDLGTLAELAELAGEPDATYEQVIVDEVQDLTIPQALFCAKFARTNAGRFFAGDEGQILYGTGFEWKRLRAAVFDLEPSIPARKSSHRLDGLTRAYRCPAGAMAIFAQLAHVRSALDGDPNPGALLPSAIRTDRRILAFDAGVIQASGWQAEVAWSTSVAFIYYAGDCSEDDARRRYEWLLGVDCPNLYSVEQCKGLEYETVFLLDMLGPIDEALDPSTPADAADKESRLHLVAYMTVAVSRVLQQLVCIDVDAPAFPEGDVEWHAGSADEFLTLVRQPALRQSQVKQQLAQADELWDVQDWAGARRWYQLAGSTRVHACDAHLALSKNPRDYRRAAALFEKGEEYARAAELYGLAGDKPAVFRAWLGGRTTDAWEQAYRAWASLPTVQRQETVERWFDQREPLDWLHMTGRFTVVFLAHAPNVRRHQSASLKRLQNQISRLNYPPKPKDKRGDTFLR